LACPLCQQRKEKRFCPAVHGKICAQCCGEQREITLDCPSDCPYLLQSRQQEREGNHRFGSDGFEREAMFPDVDISEQFIYEREHLIVGLSFALVKTARTQRSLDGHALTDRDLIAAVTSLVKSYQTLVQSNLIVVQSNYEQSTANPIHQQIAREVETMVNEFRETEQKHVGYSRLRNSEILQALVFLLRMALARTTGRPKSRAYLDFLSSQFPPAESSIVTQESSGSRLILP
jgi:hypothetical protein